MKNLIIKIKDNKKYKLLLSVILLIVGLATVICLGKLATFLISALFLSVFIGIDKFIMIAISLICVIIVLSIIIYIFLIINFNLEDE